MPTNLERRTFAGNTQRLALESQPLSRVLHSAAFQDMRKSGCTLAQILNAGQWKSAAFMKYIDEVGLCSTQFFALRVAAIVAFVRPISRKTWPLPWPLKVKRKIGLTKRVHACCWYPNGPVPWQLAAEIGSLLS